MRPPSFRGGRLAALLAAGTLATGLWAGASPAPAVRAAEKPAVQEAGPVKAEKPPGGDRAKAAIPPALEIEIQRRFNEIEKERLDDRAAYIDRWLAVVAIVLTFFGIVVAIAGLVGFRKFQQVEKEASESVKETGRHNAEAKRHSEEAKRLVEEITENRDKSQALLINAEEFDRMSKDDPEKARQVTEEVRENRQASLVDKAVAAALSLQQEGKRDEAIETWRGIAKVAEGNDDDLAVRAWFSVGYLYQEQGKHGEAIAAYDESIYLNRNLSEAYNNRGIAKNELGRHEAAMADYDEALRLKPDYADAYNNRGNVKANLGQYVAAIADYDEALRLKPDNAEAYNNRGNVKGNLCQYEAAMADFNEAIRLKPDYAGAYYNRGITSVALGDKDAARRDFGKARDWARAAGNKTLAANAEQALKELDDR